MGNCTQSQSIELHSRGELLIKRLSLNSEKGSEHCSELLTVIQGLIQSKQKTDRESALFLMLKLEEIYDSKKVVSDAIKCTKQQWLDYIAIWKRLEEQQISSDSMNLMENLKCANDFAPWLRILYLGLLQSGNILDVYETVKFTINKLKFCHLIHWNVVNEFLAATNKMKLYNIDEDDRTSPLYEDFVSASELGSFIEALVNVPWEWQSVPLYEWLESMPKEKMGQPSGISKELILKLGARVRGMKDAEFLYDAHDRAIEIFQSSLSVMTIGELLKFIETTFNQRIVTCFGYKHLIFKISKCEDFESQIKYFSKKSWYIISNSWIWDRFVTAVINKLQTIAIADHGILRFLIISEITRSQIINDFSHNVYAIDRASILEEKNLKNFKKCLYKKLKCKTKKDKAFMQEVSVDLFVTTWIKEWNDMEKLQLNPLDILKQGGQKTFQHLSTLLGRCPERLKDENVLPTFVVLLKKFLNSHRAGNIGIYAWKYLSAKEQEILAVDIISFHIYHNQDVVYDLLQSEIKVPLHQVLEGILHYTPLTDEWIEATYLRGSTPIPIIFLEYVQRQSYAYVQEVGDELLRINKEVSEIYPHYLRNSEEHRVRFHIAQSLMFLGDKYICSDELWEALFMPNELFDITCMYEMLVAKTLRSPEGILERLKSISSLSPSQQMSLLSVAHIYLVQKHWNTPKIERIKQIFSLMMTPIRGEDFQLIHFALLVIDRLNAMWKEKGLFQPIPFETSDKVTLPDIATKGQLDARLYLPVMYMILFREGRQWEYICYAFHMSNIKPLQWEHDYNCIMIKVNQFRRAIKSAFAKNSPRDWNIGEISEMKSNLVPWNILANNPDLIVIAVFINDIDRLNDLIQTYKTYEIPTLILTNSISLSSSRKDNFNIITVETKTLQKYLSEKKLEHYKIIDIQKTDRSSGFVDFTFAKKTILVLRQ